MILTVVCINVSLTLQVMCNHTHTGIDLTKYNESCEETELNSDDYLKILWTAAAELPGMLLTLDSTTICTVLLSKRVAKIACRLVLI